MLNTSTSVFTFHSSASAQKGTVCPKRTQSSNQNAIHKTNKWCKIQALPCFFCELFHDNLSQTFPTLIHARETESHLRSRLLILASLGVPDRATGCRCFCKGTRKYNTPASNKRQVPSFCLLLAFLSCAWPFMGWRFVAGSTFRVCRSCSIWIFFRNGVLVALTTRAHVKSCSFSWQESTTLMFLVLLTCVHLKLSSRQTSRVALEHRLLGIPPALLPFKTRNKDRKGTFSSVGAEIWARCCPAFCWCCVFGYLQSLQEVSSFRVDFGSQVVWPPRRRWDLCHRQLHNLQRKPLREQFIRQIFWRCTAHRDVKQLKIVWGSYLSSLVDEVASLLLAM